MGLFGKWMVRLFEHSVLMPNLICSLDDLVTCFEFYFYVLIILYALFYRSVTSNLQNLADTNIFSFTVNPVSRE